MILRRLTVRDFLVHAETTLEPTATTVLVGGNGAGKSALIDALFLIGRLARGPVERSFEARGPFSFEARRRHGASSDAEIGFEVEFADSAYGTPATWEVQAGMRDGMVCITSERLLASGTTVLRRDGAFSESCLAAARRGEAVADLDDAATNFAAQSARALTRILRYKLDPYALASSDEEPAEADTEDSGRPSPPLLGPRGQHLTALLYWFEAYASDQLEGLIDMLRECITGFDRITFSTAAPGRVSWQMEFTDARGRVDARNLSSGMTSLVGLGALVAFRRRTGNAVLMCIEEPEVGLTPGNATMAFDWLKGLTEGGAVQILASTHSPNIAHRELVSGTSSVIAVRQVDGAAQASPLRNLLLDVEGVVGVTGAMQGGGLGVAHVLRAMEEF